MDPAIVAAIGHRFIATKDKKKTKNADAQVWIEAPEIRDFLGGNYSKYMYT